MKFDCFYKVTVTTCVPESINFFEDEEIWHLGYYPYIEVLKDVEMLEDLVQAAINEGLSKAQKMASDKMNAITGGMNIPGLS